MYLGRRAKSAPDLNRGSRYLKISKISRKMSSAPSRVLRLMQIWSQVIFSDGVIQDTFATPIVSAIWVYLHRREFDWKHRETAQTSHLENGICKDWQGLKENKHLKRKGGAVQQQSWLCCKEEGLRIQGFLLEHRCFRVHFGSTSVYLLKSNPSLFCLNVQLQIFHPSSNEFRRSILFLERRTSSAAFSLSS